MEANEVGQSDTYADEGAATRNGALGGIGITLSRWIASMVHPLKACFHPIWAPLILISIACAAGSGFRNTIAIVGLTYVVALAYRGGWPSVLLASLMGALGIASLSKDKMELAKQLLKPIDEVVYQDLKQALRILRKVHYN